MPFLFTHETYAVYLMFDANYSGLHIMHDIHAIQTLIAVDDNEVNAYNKICWHFWLFALFQTVTIVFTFRRKHLL